MSLGPAELLLILAAGLAAGALNAVAGGGSFFSFPALLAVGVPPVAANASNAVALWPGSLGSAWADRATLRRLLPQLRGLAAPGLLGSALGAALLLRTGDAAFARAVPWLLGLATLLFALAPWLAAWRDGQLRRRAEARADAGGAVAGDDPRPSAASRLGAFAVAVYGGFFGAGMGILMMASLAIAGRSDVHEINALKNGLSALIYSVSALGFLAAGAVSALPTLLMLLAATAGGLAGARLARHLPAVWLRRLVLLVGLLLTLHHAGLLRPAGA